MNKQIFALIAILATLNVAYSAAACDATNGTITAGICQYNNVESQCKTWTSAKVCATCPVDSTAVTSAGVCACGETGKGNFGNTAAPALTCIADGTQPTTCPPGMMSHTDAEPCVAGDIWGCMTYDLTKAVAGKACTACYDSVAMTGTACTNAGKQVIRGIGFVTGCPDGYVAAAAGDNQDCLLCAPGCKTCAADALTTCLTCADGYEVVSGKCLMICDATCAANQCTGTKFNCTTCADGKWQTIAADAAATATVCTDKPTAKVAGCKTVNADDDTLCDECNTDLTLSADKKMCDCTDTTKGYAKFDYVAADSTADPAVEEVLAGYRCTACPTGDKACTADQICRAKAANAGVECKAKPVVVEESTCEDAALKKAGCKTCAKADGAETFECSACLTGFGTIADGACPCVNDNKQVLWVDSTSVGRCKTCATACDAAKFCAIDSTGAESCSDTAATNDAATTTDSANILTAALAILAIILA